MQDTKPAKRRRSQVSGLWGMGFAAPHALGLLAFSVIPIIVSMVISFYEWPMIGDKTFIGIDNYAKLFTDPIFRAALGNTFLFVAMYLPANLIVSLGIAAWLTPKIKGRQFYRVLFFLPTITPIVANAVVFRMLYQPNGFIDATLNTLFGVRAPNFLSDPNWAMAAVVAMSVWQGFGYNMLIFSSALDSVPDSQLEAASLDGASSWRVFWQIKLPLISPSIFFATVMTMITSFQVFAQPFILTKGGPGSSTLTLVQFIYNQGFQFQRLGLASAGAWLLFMLILGITIIQFVGQKRWVHYDA